MTKTLAKKYLSAIKNAKKKHLTCDALGRLMAIYPDVVREQLSFFEPLITMDMDYDTHDVVPAIEEYLESLEEKKVPNERVVVRKDKLEAYEGLEDFVYQKFTYQGLIVKNVTLSEVDLKVLKRLVNDELAKINKDKKKKSKHK